ncbi:DUF397 domain-containing protein [Streptomyces radicis]|uniref:DUF397 domain-containing protein n=1 Tax=Streptomyces radicis TaxID=1750517 RepID=A0A3A9W022_9ACTN|nr:DUF397 domain-containing protein [Streptomyces radicis]RKN06310.1 DUF397 domain-containing protein [Streptomyces radicis]RKN18640.1 DUF397 domain-containing protein [Streptomyces radicis]
MTNADALPVTWRKSSYSTNGGDCLEVGEGIARVVPVRDSKAPSGPAVTFSADSWDGFVETLKRGELRR